MDKKDSLFSMISLIVSVGMTFFLAMKGDVGLTIFFGVMSIINTMFLLDYT